MSSVLSRLFPRLTTPLRFSARAAGRRHMADQASPANAKQVLSSEASQAAYIQRQNQQRVPGPKGGRGSGFYLMLMGGALVTVPPISYFYWEHRKAHMKAKKEAILRDIQARYA